MVKIIDLKVFYDRCRSGPLLGPKLDSGEVAGLASVLALCLKHGLNAADTAYILATDYHETGGLMQPVRERGGNGYLHRMYDIRGARPSMARANGNTTPGDGVKYPGRGLAQITWKGNYLRVGKLLGGVDLVNRPELALDMAIATRILVEGSMGGWFTGAKLSHSLPRKGPATQGQFMLARKVINGRDKAMLIADYALIFQDDLLETGWPS